jgi:hypothetical protein
MVALGVASEAEIAVEQLAARTKAAAQAGGQCFFYPRMVGAWARKP